MTILTITKGAEQMLQTDPHGWTLTLVSVSVVFLALVILYFLYSLIGKLNSGEIKLQTPRPGKKLSYEDEIAAAVAMALEAEMGGDDEAVAIATALHLYFSERVHDIEPGIITIRRSSGAWKDKAYGFRTKPVKQ